MARPYLDLKENVGTQEKNSTATIKKNALSASAKADTKQLKQLKRK